MTDHEDEGTMLGLYINEIVALYVHLAPMEDRLNEGLARLVDRIRRFLFDRMTVEEMEKIESAVAGVTSVDEGDVGRFRAYRSFRG